MERKEVVKESARRGEEMIKRFENIRNRKGEKDRRVANTKRYTNIKRGGQRERERERKIGVYKL
jgi:hypothetical protein